MNNDQRLDTYRRINAGRPLTVRQLRQLRRKAVVETHVDEIRERKGRTGIISNILKLLGNHQPMKTSFRAQEWEERGPSVGHVDDFLNPALHGKRVKDAKVTGGLV